MRTNSKTQPVRIGIVGCGVIAQKHAEALHGRKNARLVAVADVRADAARALAAKFDVGKTYGDALEMIADPDIDGVILALPTAYRTALGLAALKAGKHLLTEKPVAMNAGEVKKLLKAQGDRVAACCSSRLRFTETARRAAKFIASGKLGTLRHLRCRAVFPAGPPPAQMPPSWRLSRAQNGGGILVNWGCYDLDFLLGLTGWSLQPRRVTGAVYGVPEQFVKRLPPGQDAETHAIGFVTFEGGVTLSYERAEMYPGPADAAWEISGEHGTLSLSMVPGHGPRVVFRQAPAAGGLKETVVWNGPDSPNADHFGPPRDFVAAIRTGATPLTGLEQALVVAQITDAIYASSAQGGKAVEIK